MANPRGNPGNKGGGRKSAYQELADAKQLHALWQEIADRKALRKKYTSGRHSAKDTFALACLEGEIAALNKLVDKLFPNRNIIDQRNYDMGEIDPLDGDLLEPKPKKKKKQSNKSKKNKK